MQYLNIYFKKYPKLENLLQGYVFRVGFLKITLLLIVILEKWII